MSESPREYHVNFEAATELDEQSKRAKRILERLAADLAANDVVLSADDRDLVLLKHAQAAAELLFNPNLTTLSVSIRDVFVSYSHKDDDFIGELVSRLEAIGITCFKADRDIRLASDWAEAIHEAIRNCRIFLSVLTPRFLTSPWVDIEAGAAKSSGKPVIPVLRYVDRSETPENFRVFQSMVVESQQQFDELVAKVQELSTGTSRWLSLQ